MVPYRELLKIIASKYPLESIDRLQDDPNDVKLSKLKLIIV